MQNVGNKNPCPLEKVQCEALRGSRVTSGLATQRATTQANSVLSVERLLSPYAYIVAVEGLKKKKRAIAVESRSVFQALCANMTRRHERNEISTPRGILTEMRHTQHM